MGIGVLRALRPGRRAPRGGQFLHFPFLQLISKAGQPVRGRLTELDLDAPATATLRVLDQGAHHAWASILMCPFHDIGHYRPADPHIPQNGFQIRPQFGPLRIGQLPGLPRQRPPDRLRPPGAEISLNRREQLLVAVKEAAATVATLHRTTLKARR